MDPGRAEGTWDLIEVFERIKGHLTAVSQLVDDANQREDKQRETMLAEAANQAAKQTIDYLVGAGETISRDRFKLAGVTAKSEAAAELTALWMGHLRQREAVGDEWVIDALCTVGPQEREARQLQEVYPQLATARGLRSYFREAIAQERDPKEPKLLRILESVRDLVGDATKKTGKLRPRDGLSDAAKTIICQLVGETSPEFQDEIPADRFRLARATSKLAAARLVKDDWESTLLGGAGSVLDTTKTELVEELLIDAQCILGPEGGPAIYPLMEAYGLEKSSTLPPPELREMVERVAGEKGDPLASRLRKLFRDRVDDAQKWQRAKDQLAVS